MSLVTSESLPQLLVIKSTSRLKNNEIVVTGRSLHCASPFFPFFFPESWDSLINDID